jgi:predicted Zn-dependent protease
VNIGARLQGANKHFKTLIIASAETARHTPAKRRLGWINVVNIVHPIDVYELSEETNPESSPLARQYEEALAKFEAKNFLGAVQSLATLLEKFPDDGPARILFGRANAAFQHGLPDETIAYRLPGK